MPILFKSHSGKIKKISKNTFRRIFNVRYASRPIAPQELRPRSLILITAITYIQKIDHSIGYGLFAFKDIAAHEIIGEYTGVLSSNLEECPDQKSNFNPYLLKYPFDSPFAIDAQKAGNETRFINHSFKNPNCERRYWQEGNILRVVFTVKKRIPKDAQLLLDYGKNYWSGENPRDLA